MGTTKADRAEGPTGFSDENKWKPEISFLNTCPRLDNEALDNIVAGTEEADCAEFNSTGGRKI
ncbi:MAG: hypothetical protein NZ807_02695 [Dehalococcoidia bacterium]|nr:hypothetical protein [Dehalococcoidia bacterium]